MTREPEDLPANWTRTFFGTWEGAAATICLAAATKVAQGRSVGVTKPRISLEEVRGFLVLSAWPHRLGRAQLAALPR